MYRLLRLCIALSLLTACGAFSSGGPKIRVEKAWARPAAATSMAGMSGTPDMPGMPGMGNSESNSAAYFLIVNDGGEADTLTGAVSEAALAAELHDTRIVSDVVIMAPVTRVDIPAHGQFEFKPAGYHVMLIGMKRELRVGETFKLTSS